jgi:altronate hydrolase
LGGTGVLTEVPEMFGAENVLLNRVDGKSTFDKAAGMIDDFKQYYLSHNQPVYENPSPGNKKGGITTLEEKSLGCIQKGGKAAVTDTLTYGQYCTRPGVNLMTGPGNDSVSLTNLLSAGVQLILFTTGRGNPLGTAVPAIKISSNTGLYERKGRWIDFNAGVLVTGQSMEVLSRLLWKMVIDVSSGRAETKNEINGSRDIMIFKFGVML